MPSEVIAFLEASVAGRLNILIAGGAGVGKTTFMRVLARMIAPDERVVTIEDQSELHLWRELRDCISLEGRPPNTEGRGAITIQMLVHEALRMSPDRIIIGEVRGGEALDLLDAMNTGHAVYLKVYNGTRWGFSPAARRQSTFGSPTTPICSASESSGRRGNVVGWRIISGGS
jgi:type IV secretory pathway ATPase VirB11/archaellum biosynthesis ATPase